VAEVNSSLQQFLHRNFNHFSSSLKGRLGFRRYRFRSPGTASFFAGLLPARI